MPQSLCQFYAHLVFSTKGREPCLSAAVLPRLHAYLAGAAHAVNCPAVQVGGVADHVHLLLRLGRTISISELVKALKTESSKWMKSDGGVAEFSWQAGYGAFSVSASQVDVVAAYIRNQEAHHRTRSFQDEFRTLLQRYKIPYDENHVWD